MLAAPVALEERRELTGLLLMLAGLRLPTGELLAAARRNPMIDELLRESGVAEEFIREGMERGRQEGLERGRDEALRQSVRRALKAVHEAFLSGFKRHGDNGRLVQPARLPGA